MALHLISALRGTFYIYTVLKSDSQQLLCFNSYCAFQSSLDGIEGVCDEFSSHTHGVTLYLSHQTLWSSFLNIP